jgi:hypothetical protein
MKMTKSKLKGIIREEMMNEAKKQHPSTNRARNAAISSAEKYLKNNPVKKKTAKTNVGFSNEMGALYVSKGGGKSVELYKADVEQIIKQYKKFKSKMD